MSLTLTFIHMLCNCEPPINLLVIPCEITNLSLSLAVMHVEGPMYSNQPTLASREESLEFGDCDPSESSSIQLFQQQGCIALMHGMLR
jgi:hypothetical protein